MIPVDFDYYKPESIEEAARLHEQLDRQKMLPLYYSGGTEIITLLRLDLIQTKAVIDIKAIHECREHILGEDYLVLGSSLTLTQIEERNAFPLLTSVSKEIADHTARNKITLGGNICGEIFYREAVLPLLLTDSLFVIGGPQGVKILPAHEAFQQTMQLGRGEFLIQTLTRKDFLGMPYMSVKIRQQWETGYPLVTIAALKAKGEIRAAFSGLCSFPFRSKRMEDELNRKDGTLDVRMDRALRHIPAPVLNDIEGSAEYRLFVLKNTLTDILTVWEVEQNA
ncbi:FAD binding domain-containing protein [Peribacillus kribbensis]|uniref:FAD binding domain-containing protein n=1 Tax=Peribacillus kribbensis TaxID=356658 RepID=UPI0004000F71|nr:FAD binding domain-containing protein [Peribacillus kribbensis]